MTDNAQDGASKAPRRFGVLGTGHWARWCHGAALAAHPEVELVGFWGRDPAKAEDAAKHEGGRGFADLDALLAEVDAVAIALPPDIQAPLAVRAARAGRHLLLDKPLALDVSAADEVVVAVRETGVASVNFVTLLYQPEVMDWLARMRELAERHGPWEGVVASLAGAIDVPGGPYADSLWRQQRGGLWDVGPHALSLVLSLLPPVERVSAARGVRDTVNLGLEHTGGPGSSLTLTVTAPENAQGASLVVWGPGGRHALPVLTGGAREAFARAVDQLRESARSGRPHPLDALYARDVVAVLDAAERQLSRPLPDRAAVPRPFATEAAPTAG
ncbi:Gfo/Idh/MocA family protein [Streptomyces cavernae]|uniref:Gfo/Idh/MocA family protein n=1 Tax=Streptomyces cavernae TaxID=2259034 RepID=UPI000FEBE59A|nr:Gfo/Idh/MocA family oxidoreductase [Streptomyces cavernae]